MAPNQRKGQNPSLFGTARCHECHGDRCMPCAKLRERNRERARMGLCHGRMTLEFGPMRREQQLNATAARNPMEAALQAGSETKAVFRWGDPLAPVHFPDTLLYPNIGGMCLCTVGVAQFFGACGHVGLCRQCLLMHLKISPSPDKCPYCRVNTTFYMLH
ncbi:hypothetical protein niasHT_039238 [Heterodera trifolii]|uniref:RING-type domain-containing protein n=1 Tax=Heterodera trifolii TaxID=157864 RepID=A0ABD2J8L3_9BILA